MSCFFLQPWHSLLRTFMSKHLAISIALLHNHSITSFLPGSIATNSTVRKFLSTAICQNMFFFFSIIKHGCTGHSSGCCKQGFVVLGIHSQYRGGGMFIMPQNLPANACHGSSRTIEDRKHNHVFERVFHSTQCLTCFLFLYISPSAKIFMSIKWHPVRLLLAGFYFFSLSEAD